MTGEENAHYYARRAQQERAWAERAANEAVKTVHQTLAAEYERRLAGGEATP